MFKSVALALLALGATQAQAAPTCLFGEEIGNLEEITRLEIQWGVIKTFKRSRIGSGLPMVSVTVIKDKVTGREFHMNTTFRHKDDGDNTVGWIEEVTDAAQSDGGAKGEGRVVAVIGDSFFDTCKVFAN